MHKENINIRLLWDKLIQKVTKRHHLLTLIIITHLEVLETEKDKTKPNKKVVLYSHDWLDHIGWL